MPSDIIHTGKLSNLQLEAIVYGCQRHMIDLPKQPMPSSHPALPVNDKENVHSAIPKTEPVDAKDARGDVKKDAKGDVTKDAKGDVRAVTPPNPASDGRKRDPPAKRAGFLLGDGAGMGKGRTLAGFVVENIARGRKKHVWISVSSDLYEG